MTKAKLEEWLAPVALFTALIGIIVSAVEAVTKFMGVWAGQYYVTVTVMWIVVVVLAFRFPMPWPTGQRLSSRRVRNAIIALATLGWLFAIGWSIYEYKWRKTERYIYGGAPPAGIFATSVFAQTPLARPFAIEAFGLDEDLCSFRESETVLFGMGPRRYRTFEFSRVANQVLGSGRCFGPRGERPVRDAWRLLSQQVTKRGQQKYLGYLKEPEDLSRLVRERGDILAEIMFTDAELRGMRDRAAEDYKAIMEWLTTCVGVKQPVFTFVIRNSSAKSVLLTQLVYDVQEVGTVLGAPTGPLLPQLIYDHDIKHTVGMQARPLKPPLQIAPAERLSFSVRLRPSEKGDGLAWLMRIRVVDANGGSAETDLFQLIMAKG